MGFFRCPHRVVLSSRIYEGEHMLVLRQYRDANELFAKLVSKWINWESRRQCRLRCCFRDWLITLYESGRQSWPYLPFQLMPEPSISFNEFEGLRFTEDFRPRTLWIDHTHVQIPLFNQARVTKPPWIQFVPVRPKKTR